MTESEPWSETHDTEDGYTYGVSKVDRKVDPIWLR